MTGGQHVTVLCLMVLVPSTLAWVSRICRSGRVTIGIAYFLAAILIANKFMGLSMVYRDGVLSWRDVLPMHLCDWSMLATIVALLTRRQLPYEMSYFWGLSGGMQAILTPDIDVGFDNIRAWTFFISHAGGIAAVLYLTFALKMRPRARSMWVVFVWSQIYLFAAVIVNVLLDANYGYLCAKPLQPSLLDYMGPWPCYILTMELLTVLSFLLYYAPFYLWDKWRAKTVTVASAS